MDGLHIQVERIEDHRVESALVKVVPKEEEKEETEGEEREKADE